MYLTDYSSDICDCTNSTQGELNRRPVIHIYHQQLPETKKRMTHSNMAPGDGRQNEESKEKLDHYGPVVRGATGQPHNQHATFALAPTLYAPFPSRVRLERAKLLPQPGESPDNIERQTQLGAEEEGQSGRQVIVQFNQRAVQ